MRSSAQILNPTDDESDPGAEEARAQAAVEPRDEGLGNLRDSLDGYSQGYHEGYDYVALDAEGLEYTPIRAILVPIPIQRIPFTKIKCRVGILNIRTKITK